MAATDHAARARAFVGTRFRAQGRDENGLDCVGLVLKVFDIPAEHVRRNYSLRGDHLSEIMAELDRHFRPLEGAQARPGDVLLMRPAEHQLHLAVRTDLGFVHADARIRRVVETPGAPRWPLLGIFRKRRKH